MSTELVPFTGDRLAQARAFAGLTDEELKRRAVKAAAEKNSLELWGLCAAYLASDSLAGITASKHTVRAYRKGVEVLVEYASQQAWNLLHPNRREPALYVASLLAAGLKPATVQNRMAGANLLYRALRWASATEADPFADVKRPKDRTKGIVKNPPYGADFVSAMVEIAGPEDQVLILLLSHAGLRIAEALAIDWEHVDFQKKRLLIAHGKGDKARRVPLSRKLEEALKNWQLQTGGRSGAVFSFKAYSTAYYRLQKLARTLGRGHEFRGFHAGRKLAGTRLYAQVKDFTRVALFLGHEQVDTTRRYVEMPEDDLSEAVRDFD